MERTRKPKAAPTAAAPKDTEAAKTAGAAGQPDAEKPGASGAQQAAQGRGKPGHPTAGDAPSPEPGSRSDEGQGGAGEGAGGAPSPDAPAPLRGLVVWVTGPAKGRWRIGRKFGPDPVGIPLEELSEDEKERLIADPELRLETYALPEAD